LQGERRLKSGRESDNSHAHSAGGAWLAVSRDRRINRAPKRRLHRRSRAGAGWNFQRAQAKDLLSRPALVDATTMHAAIVDDSLATRTILSSMLHECGVTVSEAGDHESALTLLRSRPDIGLVLIDWQLCPAGGYELAYQIRNEARFAGRRIIMVTAEAGIDEVANALEVGIDDYLTKPFSLATIREKLDLLSLMAA